MNYASTRGQEHGISASYAILHGLAEDGGLYIPEQFPPLPCSLSALPELSYQELAYRVMQPYFSDFTEEEIRDCVMKAYDSKFEDPGIAPLVKHDHANFLELFHGRTIAFKDMALSILPYLMVVSAKKQQATERIVILTATSGDTGKAAMAGFQDVPGTEIIVFYPKDGVSRFQELQMRMQKGGNTHVAAVHGNFDDAQSAVKEIFSDRGFAKRIAEKNMRLSSANSINIGRLVPQIVYYIYAYGQMLKQGTISVGEEVNVCVPTGNFGNILAAYFAKQMGLPVKKLLCASNENRVLADFFRTGSYDKNRPFILTTSPSMDILLSSNLERLLYLSCGRSGKKTRELMESLRTGGRYEISGEMHDFMADFVGGCAEEAEVYETIKALFRKEGYLIDPHTAVAKAVLEKYQRESGDRTETILASTASPYKFAPSVLEAIELPVPAELMEQMAEISRQSHTVFPRAISDVRDGEIRHSTVTEIRDMRDTVLRFLKNAE